MTRTALRWCHPILGPRVFLPWPMRLAAVLLATGLAAAGPQVPAAGPQSKVSDTPAATSMARDVIDRINRAYHTLVEAGCPGYEAVYAATTNGEQVGRATVTWSRGQDEVGVELQLNPGFSTSKESRDEFVFLVSSSLSEHNSQLAFSPGMRAVRWGEDYIVDDIAPAPETQVRQWHMVVSGDCSRARLSIGYLGGNREEIEYTGRPYRGGYLLATKMARYPRSGVVVQAAFTYSDEQSYPFVRRLDLRESLEGSTKVTSIVLDLENVTFR
jgi:hypothetical protein